MALEGTLEDFSLADIFQLIGIQRKTGILTLKNSEESVTVMFHNGMVIGADTHPRKLEDRIGKVLVKTGLITQDQLKDALELQQKTLQKIGFILVNHNYISKQQLKEALQIQVTQMIYRLFRWNKGEYYFDQKTKVDPDSDEAIPPMSAESILMEGIHMIDEWPVIQKKIPSFQMVFKPAIPIDELDLGLNGPDSSGDSDKVRLNKEEEAVYFLVNGTNSVADVIESSKMGEFHTCKALYDLLERKIIEPSIHTPRMRKEPTFSAHVPVEEKPRSLRMLYPVLALLILIPVLLNYRDPLKLAFVPFFESSDGDALKMKVNSSRLGLVDSAVLMYFYVNGELPLKLDELVEKQYLRREDVVDPWMRPYIYGAKGDTYLLAGHGKNGKVDEALEIRRTVTKPPPEIPKPKTPEPTIRFANP